MKDENILEVSDLKVYYPQRKRRSLKMLDVKAVDGISFSVTEGETFGIVGESGCGKTTTGKAIVKLEPVTNGSIQYKGNEIAHTAKRSKDELSIQMIFQDSHTSLNPQMSVGSSIMEPLNIQNIGSPTEREEKVKSLMEKVGLSPTLASRYPHEFSGGQRQRVCIARALAIEPDLIICDEPVSALDVSIQAQILNLMNEIQKDLGITYIFISHDLSVIKHFCDTVAVMYLGKIVELASKEDLFNNPIHPYTKALLQSIPVADPSNIKDTVSLTDEIPSSLDPPSGCVFHTRCNEATSECKEIVPKLSHIGEDRKVACIHVNK